MRHYFPTSRAVYMTERLLTVPSRDHGVLFLKLVSTVPAAIKLRAHEKPFQKTIPYFHCGAPYGDHTHLTFMNDETLIYTLDSDQCSISDHRFSLDWGLKTGGITVTAFFCGIYYFLFTCFSMTSNWSSVMAPISQSL